MDEGRLAQATRAAAANLAAGGAATTADGSTLYCTFPGGARVVVRNSLGRVPTFSGEHLLSQVSGEIVRAMLANEKTTRP